MSLFDQGRGIVIAGNPGSPPAALDRLSPFLAMWVVPITNRHLRFLASTSSFSTLAKERLLAPNVK